MASKIVGATLRFVDKFSGPMGEALKKMEESQRQAKRLGRQVERMGKKMQDVGSGLSKGITLPVVAIGTASIGAAANFEESMSRVKAISGATADDMIALSDKAKEMGSTTKFSASESADAMQYMALAGWGTQDMLDGIAGIMDLAAASGDDLATTSDIVTDSLTAFGMAASDSSHFSDVMAAAMSNSNTTVSQLGEAFKYCGSLAGGLGYSVEDVSVYLGLMANSGIKASNSGTAMRKAMTALQGDVKLSGDALGDYTLSCTNQDGSMRELSEIMTDARGAFEQMSESERAINAEAIAGKTGMAGFLAIMNASESDVGKLSDSIYGWSGSASEMASVMQDNLAGQLTLLKSQFEGVAITIGEKLIPYVMQGVDWISGLADKFSKLSDSQQNTIIKISLVAAAIGPCLIIVGKTTKGVGALIKNTKTIVKVLGLFRISTIKSTASMVKQGAVLIGQKAQMAAATAGIIAKTVAEKSMAIASNIGAAAQWALNTSMYGCPIVWIIAGIAAVIAIGVLLWKNWDTVKEKAGVLWEGMKNIFGGVGDWFGSLWDGVKSGFKAFVNFIIKGLNFIPEGLNKLSVKIPDWVPKVGGKSLGFTLPTIPYLAKGTDNWIGGLAVTQDRGGELIDLPRGSRVIPHDESIREAYKDGAK